MMKTILRAALITLILFSFATISRAETKIIGVYTDHNSESCVKHGVDILVNTLKNEGFEPAILNQFSGYDPIGPHIYIVNLSKDNSFTSLVDKQAGAKIPDKPESYILYKYNDRIVAAGTDAVGAMYAAYELAEQIEINGLDKLLSDLKTKVYAPSAELRAVNPFFHVEAFNDQNSWFYDEKYWQTYLDELSMDRYNLLDVHAMYELISTYFPNCYPYFLHSDKFPFIGIDQAQAAKNLAMLNKIIAMAKDRGIRVSLMSYQANWKKTDNDKVRNSTDEELEAYEAEMVTKLINGAPDLWMTGFRIGETGRQPDFFKKSYLKGIDDSGRKINMFTRSWLAKPVQVRSLADAYPGRFYLEIKYNGEQLGLPYHAMTTNRKGAAPSYTWEDYTDWPRNYKIIWQIRSNGTHRLFRWGDPVFAARTMKSLQFGHAVGFTMEPMTSYYPPTDFFHKNHADYDYFTWDHQRNWLWYMLWGRLAYDPSTPDAVWLNRFEKHFGKAAARDVFDTVTSMSRIVPLIYSYRCLGPDHRNMAAEYETGGSLEDFARNYPLDPESMRSIDEYVRWTLFDGELNGAKIGPFKVADLLDSYADQANAAAKKAAELIDPEKNLEFKDLTHELELLTHLARYYSNKIRAATYFEFFQVKNTGDDLGEAVYDTMLAHNEWEKLSAAGEKYYQPLLDTLRMRGQVKKNTFTWRDVEPQLKKDDEQLDAAMKDFDADKTPAIWHRPMWRAQKGSPIAISVTCTGGKFDGKPVLHYRNKNTDEDRWKLLDMGYTEEASVNSAQIPAEDTAADIEYFITAKAGDKELRYPSGKGSKTRPGKFTAEEYADGTAKRVTNELKKIDNKEKAEYLTIKFIPESDPPVLSVDKIDILDDGKLARFTVSAKDQSKVTHVELHYKPMPTFSLWQIMDMKQTAPGVFVAETKLTSEGLLYFFNAADEYNNAAAYPDFLKETPYRWIDSWDPAKNPYEGKVVGIRK